MDLKGCTNGELAAAAGVKPPSVSDWTNGKTLTLKASTAHRAAQFLGVNFLWLTEGRGPMKPGNVTPGPDLHGTAPLISWVQAGHWKDAEDPLYPGQGERIATAYHVQEHTYALRVRGDSMEPKFPDGAIIIVEPDENPQPGQYIIVRQNGDEATFKQLVQDGSKLYLKPINARYPIMELNPDAVFCGVVKRIEMDV